MQEPYAIAAALTHADNASTAGCNSRFANMRQRNQSIFIAARCHNARIIFGRGVEVVIVIVEPSGAQSLCLRWREHTQSGAGLEALRLHRGNHCGELG